MSSKCDFCNKAIQPTIPRRRVYYVGYLEIKQNWGQRLEKEYHLECWEKMERLTKKTSKSKEGGKA